ncbi:MAG: methionyl-tRNA formyltransferase, partial [Pseudomonadota bacterium]
MYPASRIIFYGTPEFALESLKALVDGGYLVECVVTAPDKPAGRGMKLRASKVKEYALQQGLRILQPEKLSDPSFIEELSQLEPDLQVVVAFRMMPRAVWHLPRLGTFNLHASLLPQYRGAAPINWAVINGEEETGLTTFFLQEKIDTGDIIFSEVMKIGPDETAGELHDRMKVKGAELVVKTVAAVFSGNINPKPQPLVPNPQSLL